MHRELSRALLVGMPASALLLLDLWLRPWVPLPPDLRLSLPPLQGLVGVAARSWVPPLEISV